MNAARSPQESPPAIFLLGPTASGKSELALDLAQDFPFEIISVDSAQVYRYMDIGTAKPDGAARAAVPHHLIDLVLPTEAYSAGKFRRDAMKVTQEIRGRGKTPLFVGGTMLYFKSLREGLSELPEADPELRAEIDSRAAERGWAQLHRELSALDPIAAEKIKPGDSQRIQRALEVCMLSGRRFSEMRERRPAPFPAITVALVPSERAVLHERVAIRFRSMLERGLIEEVQWLRRDFALTPAMPSMRCVGYRQVWRYLEGEYDRGELEEQAVAATRQLAKRQLTWIRAMKHVTQFDCFDSSLRDQLKLFIEVSFFRLPR